MTKLNTILWAVLFSPFALATYEEATITNFGEIEHYVDRELEALRAEGVQHPEQSLLLLLDWDRTLSRYEGTLDPLSEVSDAALKPYAKSTIATMDSLNNKHIKIMVLTSRGKGKEHSYEDLEPFVSAMIEGAHLRGPEPLNPAYKIGDSKTIQLPNKNYVIITERVIFAGSQNGMSSKAPAIGQMLNFDAFKDVKRIIVAENTRRHLHGFGIVFSGRGEHVTGLYYPKYGDENPAAVVVNPMDEVLRNAVVQHRVPGVVAMVTSANAVVFQSAYGMQNVKEKKTMALDTIFRISSLTKPLTVVAVLQLVEKGEIKVDEPAKTYMPEIGEMQVVDHIDKVSGEAVLRHPKTPVTIRHLLTHTSGLVYDRWNKELHALRKVNHDLKEPLLFDPGSKWEYGTSTGWLGRIVEKISGLSLEDYFQENILRPLGMKDTSYNLDPQKQSRLVTLHQREGDGTLTEVPPAHVAPVKSFSGGGGLYSTCPDYVLFMRMIMNGGHLGSVVILKEETVALMGANQIGDLLLHEFKSTNPRQSLDGAVPGGLDKFGFGFALNTKPNPGGRSAMSMAWAGLENIFFWIDPAQNTAAVLMMQILPFMDEAPIRVLKEFEHAVYTPQNN